FQSRPHPPSPPFPYTTLFRSGVFLLRTLQLEDRQQRAFGRDVRLELAVIEFGDVAYVEALLLHAQSLAAGGERAPGGGELPVERAQREVALRHVRGQGDEHGLARGLAREEVCARGLRCVAQPSPQVDLV